MGYNLPLTDFSRLLVNSQNLTSLKLIGAGKNGDPIPVLHILAGCRQLKVGEESNLVNFHHMLVVSIDHLWTLASIAELSRQGFKGTFHLSLPISSHEDGECFSIQKIIIESRK